ncbi:ComEC/Rec2 family competence protein [Roseibacterium beibuensis]|uniref:ComEC/Rec2 family competence protein n=1 Tax=[Roseibacterium] beibuensis TaxID=1193142 RepID=UPI00217D1E0E|nr:ComEC/Rec2 family competence protein [Roseibacterium beibuensis]MCS6625161.1 ComEC/Rec2 family competence protein [Roseibacterium beibuensis]
MHSLRARTAGFLRAQIVMQSLRWRLWAPVALGGGCAVYFSLKAEPAAWPLLIFAVLAAVGWLGGRRMGLGRGWTLPLMLLACFALGLAVAKLRADAVTAPIAPAMAEPTVVEGWVVDVDSPGAAGPRVVIAPVSVRGLAPEDTPVRLRATVRGAAPEPGEAVRLFAILNPPPAPASPGAYDFARNAFFQSMGGVAFGLGEARPAFLSPPPWRLRLEMWVNGVRYDLAKRIVARQGERTGGIAAAMTTGHEAWLDPADVDVMRDSGLAHILSISGLHMAVVGGFAFFLVRLLVAAWPWLALRVPGKKVAAACGLLAVGTYLVISGAPPPAERAAITASIAFVAILLDRQAITMHALAVAAFVVLLLQPEAIVTPGFQMSFAATAALVALVEAWPRRPREISAPWPILLVQRSGAWVGAAILASLVAGAATGPFAMQHFNRSAMYGLGANLATAPVSDFLIMPALALGALLEPLGLGAPFLWVATKGIELMLAIGTFTAGLPGAVRTIASAPDYVLPIAFLGVLFCCLWRGPLRWLGLPFAAAVMLWPRAPTPDLWIGDGGTNGAWVEAGEAVVARPGVRQFAVDVWSRRRGVTPVERPAEGWACTRFSCAPGTPEAGPLAMWWGRRAPSAEQLDALCQSAPVVSVRAAVSALPASCEGRLVLDGVDHARGGAVELWREGPAAENRWRAVWSAQVRGDRPWSRVGDPDVSDSGG